MSDTNKTPPDLRKKNSAATWDAANSPSPWIQINPADSILVRSLEGIKDDFLPVVAAAKTVIEIVKTILEAAINLVVLGADLGAAAIQAAIDTLRTLLTDLLNVGTFHTLVVPVSRTDLETSGKIMTDAFLGGNPFPEKLPVSAAELVGSGGNYGFLNTVIQSLEDTKDPNRPRFSQDAHIAAGVVLLGTTNFYELYEVIDKFTRALRIPGVQSYHAPTPQPREFRAFVVPSSYGTKFGGAGVDNIVGSPDADHPYAVKLEWGHVDRTVDVDDEGNTTYIKRVTVYRAQDPNVLDAAQTPTKWAEYEIDSMSFDTLTTEFFDNTIERGNNYTYGVGFEIAIEDADGNELLSTIRTIKTTRVSTVEAKMPATRGVPPDWVQYNLLDVLFPQAREFVERHLVPFLDSFEDSLSDSKKALEEYVEFLENEINRYSSWAQDILDRLNELVEALTWPRIYAGATMIYSEPTLDGGGGNRYLISQLAEALYNTDDTNRPPFDSGNEAVAGIIFMAGSESAGATKKFQTFLETFLGTAGATVGSAIQQALDSIDYLTQQAEHARCMSPAFEAVACTETEDAGNAFNAQFESALEAAECAKKS
ncbi:MAG: hypothetical protein DRJ03_01740 [Chloroflexi bacterium]|nr:MAG: hypothetical protein DRJ03_01740 [Chloroflexota bacterium]